MATARPDYYCHKCQLHIGHVANYECPRCKESFIEEVPAQNPSTQAQGGPRHVGETLQFHSPNAYGNTTIFIGGHPTHDPNGNGDFGTLIQSIMTQLAGGLVGTATPQFPFVMHNGGPAGFLDPSNIDAFLTQFLNQMGENSGPAPAPENRINAIPTVKVTGEQARDNLQCAICMDDFKENDEAKRLPCSHCFHEDCILRWLRLHGTCPTCRVTLETDNANNREYVNYRPNQQQQQPQQASSPSSSSSNNNNRRNDGGNHGSSSSAGSTLLDFD